MSSPPASAPSLTTDAAPYPEWRVACLVVVFAILPFLPALRNDFVYDDMTFILNNPWILSWRNLHALLLETTANGRPGVEIPFWRPLRNLHYLIDSTIAGGLTAPTGPLGPAWFHLMNLIWHGLAALGFYGLARRLGLSQVPAALAALLWSVHPVQSESVAWAKERDGVMSGAFLMAALWAALGRTWRSVLASLLLLTCALLSKESAVVFAPVLLCVGWVAWCSGRNDCAFLNRMGFLLVAGTIATVVFLYFRTQVIGGLAQTTQHMGGTHANTLWTMCGMFLRYLGLVANVLPLEISYKHLQAARGFEPLPALGALVLVGWSVAVLVLARRAPMVAAGMAWFLIALIPVSNLVPTLQWMAVRFLYFPLGGMALIGGFAAEAAYRRVMSVPPDQRSPLPQAVAVLLPVGLAVMTFFQVLVWRDSGTLWTNAYLINPRNEDAIMGYSRSAMVAGRLEEALQVIDTYPFNTSRRDEEYAHGTRAEILHLLGRPEESLAEIERGLALRPDSHALLLMRALQLDRLKRPADTAVAFVELLRLDPSSVPALEWLETYHRGRGDTSAADFYLERLTMIRTKPRTEWRFVSYRAVGS